MIILTTLLLNAYIVLLSFQVNGIADTNAIRLPILIFMAAECILVLLLHSGIRDKRSVVRLPGFILCAIVFIFYVLAHIISVKLSTSKLIELIFFPVCLIVTYFNFISIQEEKTFDQIVDIQFYYLLIVAGTFLLAQVWKRGEYTKNVNTVYYVIFALPFILQNPNNKKKWVGLGIIFACLFLSLKRAPLLAVGLAMIFYFNTEQTMNKVASRALLVLVGVLVCDAIFSTLFDIHLLSRMMTLTEDGGSGRVDLAQQTIDLLKTSSFKQLILGHKLNSTFSVFRYGAHNDFLEVLYRMGLFGFSLYIGFFVSMITMIVRASKAEDFISANFMKASLIMFAVVSFSSQLIFLPTYVGLVAMSISFGFAYNNFKSDQNEKIPEGGT